MICGYRILINTKTIPILLFINYRNWYILSIRYKQIMDISLILPVCYALTAFLLCQINETA